MKGIVSRQGGRKPFAYKWQAFVAGVSWKRRELSTMEYTTIAAVASATNYLHQDSKDRDAKKRAARPIRKPEEKASPWAAVVFGDGSYVYDREGQGYEETKHFDISG